jgi:hypothetical protein
MWAHYRIGAGLMKRTEALIRTVHEEQGMQREQSVGEQP